MNNFELDKRSKELVDTTTHYELARRVAEYEAKDHGYFTDANGQVWESCSPKDNNEGQTFRKISE